MTSPAPPPAPSYPPPLAAPPARFVGLAWSSLILGIIGIAFSPLPIINNISALVAVVGIILGLIALFGSRKGLALIGIGLRVLAVVFTVAKQNNDVAVLDGQGGRISGQQEPSGTPQQLTFGQSFTYEDGTVVNVAPPVPYQPSSTAFIAGGAARSVAMKVAITNGTTKPLNLSGVGIQATAGEQAVEEVFDSEKGLHGPPPQTLLQGQRQTFTVAFGLPSRERTGFRCRSTLAGSATSRCSTPGRCRGRV